MKHLVIYIHGKGGSAAEAEHYRPFFPESDVIGLEYVAQTPWEAREEFPRLFDSLSKGYASITLIANSIGAFFAMNALADKPIARALLISPIVHMERLILNMMDWAHVTEDELRAQGTIPTELGETLSWAYLCDVRAHPICWCIPTNILYGENDTMTAPNSISAFAREIGASLTIMPGGEHWFHTQAQMAFLDQWLLQAIRA